MSEDTRTAANAQARFIVERLKRAMPALSGGSPEARAEAVRRLEGALAAYDALRDGKTIVVDPIGSKCEVRS